MTWIREDFYNIKPFTPQPVDKDNDWPEPFAEVPDKDEKKRKVDVFPESRLNWRQCLQQHHRSSASLCGVILRIDEAPKHKRLLLVFDGKDLGGVELSPSVKEPVKIGDVVMVRVDEVLEMGSAPNATQSVCSIHKIIKSNSIKATLDPSDRYEFEKPYCMPWELVAPKYHTFKELSMSQTIKYSRLLATVAKKSHGQGFTQLLLKDSNGDLAYAKLYQKYTCRTDGIIREALVNVGNRLIISDCGVSLNATMHTVHIRKSCLIEILPACETFPVDALTPTEIATAADELQLSIKQAARRALNLPCATEETISTTGYITEFTLDRWNAVNGTCPACKKRSTITSGEGTLQCTFCGVNRAAVDWRLSFNINVSISDHSGTWQHLYLRDPLCTEFISVSPSTCLRMDDNAKRLLHLNYLFTSVHVDIEVKKDATGLLSTRVLTINSAEQSLLPSEDVDR